MHVALKPVEHLLFETDLVLVADFRCRPDDALFRDSGPSNADCIVFPSTCTKIIRPHGRTTFESPADVSFMNHGEEYRREAISEEGTYSTWYTLNDELLRELLDGRAFAHPPRSIPVRTILAQRRLFAGIRSGAVLDSLAVEEKLISLTRMIVGTDRERTAVCRATAYLLAHFSEPVSLSHVASAAGASVSYLSRAFHAATGMTMSAFRQRVRLTRSLDLLPQYEGNVTDLALELGYSSHSHFTACFRTLFDMSPTEFLAGR